jgi:hypothetical protein
MTSLGDTDLILGQVSQGAIPAFVDAVSSADNRPVAHEVIFNGILDLYGFDPLLVNFTDPVATVTRLRRVAPGDGKSGERKVESKSGDDHDFELLDLRSRPVSSRQSPAAGSKDPESAVDAAKALLAKAGLKVSS